MKNLNFYILMICFAAFVSCEEDAVRPLINNDGVAPDAPEVVSVEAAPGGSTITFNAPDNDTDVLYIVAEYYRVDGGELISVKSSIFNNELFVEGFAESKEYEVKLYAVDQSENRSEAVSVMITPDAPAYEAVCSSLTYQAGFGGIVLNWDNPEGGDIAIEVYSVDPNNQSLIFEDAIYTSNSSPDSGHNILGFEAVETDFVIIAKDRYDNECGEVRATITPLFEELIPRQFYQGIFQTHDSPDAYSWTIDRMYDGIIGNQGFHTSPTYSDPDGELPEYADWAWFDDYTGNWVYPNVQMWTIDLGQLTKLSRIKFWQRVNYFFRHANPKIFDLWGATELNPEGTLDGWTLLLENAEVIKPSGTREFAENTEEDNEAGNLGHNFSIPANMPPVRYVRWVQKLSWNYSTAFFHLTEIEFYGQLQ